MKIKDLSDYKTDEVSALMRRIPFFKELQEADQFQFDLLLNHSCIVELEPGETIMRRGDKGSWLYFLIKGQLGVYLEADLSGAPINQITPGELFGDLALLCDHERKASVAADKSAKPALLFATDFSVFGELLEFGQISLKTKLIFYRTMVHSIRWRLEVNRMETPDHDLFARLRQVPVYSGEKGTVAELESLHVQAQYLANLLDLWNSDDAPVLDVIVSRPSDEQH